MRCRRLEDNDLVQNLLDRSDDRLVSIDDFYRHYRAIFFTRYKRVHKGCPIHNLKKMVCRLASTYLPTVEHKAGRTTTIGFYRQSVSFSINAQRLSP